MNAKTQEPFDGLLLNFVLNGFLKYCRTSLIVMYIGHFYRPLYMHICSCYCKHVSQYWWNEPTVVSGLAADIQRATSNLLLVGKGNVCYLFATLAVRLVGKSRMRHVQLGLVFGHQVIAVVQLRCMSWEPWIWNHIYLLISLSVESPRLNPARCLWWIFTPGTNLVFTLPS